MMLLVVLAVPLAGALLLARWRGGLATAVHAVTAALTLAAALAVALAVHMDGVLTALDGFLRADALSAWMIMLIGLVDGLAATEAPRYASGRFYPLFHLFVFTMLLAVTTDDVGLMWVAIEGTTLASVFLVNFEGTRASLEAAYKYLLICSVGIAIAFLGTVLVYFADIQLFSDEVDALRWTTLLRVAPRLPPRVMELAFVFLVVGYGTKAGLVPMHTWLPDAHSEAPAPVSALMSGVLLAVGVYALLRFKPVVDLAAGPAFARRILLVLGVASMAVAALFLWTSQNFKRMLAYSSVEHIGIACLGLGFGGAWGVTGALLHLANHALAKSALFLLAGRIRAAYDSAEVLAVRGLLGPLPRTGGAFLAAMLALMGLPPFGLFTSEVRGGRPGAPRPGVRGAAADDADDAPRRPGAASRARVTGGVAGGPRGRRAPAAPAHGARVAPRSRPGTRPDRGRGGRLR
ncbi:MAG: hydrogenase 4 subunit F [Candidatus Rokuibacteriota bacterium]|nr:MAG: hydrogenase 4 subunit F [Candidatus Rokubacteria bacterium]